MKRWLLNLLAAVSLALWAVAAILWCMDAEAPSESRLVGYSTPTFNIGLAQDIEADRSWQRPGDYRWIVISRYRPLQAPIVDPLLSAPLYNIGRSSFLGLQWNRRYISNFRANDLVAANGHLTIYGREDRMALPLAYIYLSSLAPLALIAKSLRPELPTIIETTRCRLRRWRSTAQRHPALTAAFVPFVVAHVTAVGLFAISGWHFWFFLGSAIGPFSLGTVPFVAIVAAATFLLPKGRGPRSFIAAVLVGLGIAVGSTFLLSLFLAMLLGMFFQGFEFFTPLYPWLAGAVVGLLVTVWSRPPEPRFPAGLCPFCGYDLRATPHRCPECGTVPETSPS